MNDIILLKYKEEGGVVYCIALRIVSCNGVSIFGAGMSIMKAFTQL